MSKCPFRKLTVINNVGKDGIVSSGTMVEEFGECIKSGCMAWVEGPEKGYFYCARLGAFPIAEYPDRLASKEII